VFKAVVVPKFFAVVGGNDQSRPVVHAPLFKCSNQFADLDVDEVDLGMIDGRHVVDILGRRVGHGRCGVVGFFAVDGPVFALFH